MTSSWNLLSVYFLFFLSMDIGGMFLSRGDWVFVKARRMPEFSVSSAGLSVRHVPRNGGDPMLVLFPCRRGGVSFRLAGLFLDKCFCLRGRFLEAEGSASDSGPDFFSPPRPLIVVVCFSSDDRRAPFGSLSFLRHHEPRPPPVV